MTIKKQRPRGWASASGWWIAALIWPVVVLFLMARNRGNTSTLSTN